ncbi:MAG: hypothetical protein RLY78_2385 [Pseudomonadota bacterium]
MSSEAVATASGGPRARVDRALRHAAVKPLLWALLLTPLALLIHGAATDRLGANPAEALLRGSGDWSLRVLLLALAVTPLREALHLPSLARLRRPTGLFAFFWCSLHLLAWAWLDQGLEAAALLTDIGKRPFILVGVLAWGLLAALALTSPQRVVRALGGARWRALHRGAYVAGLLGLLHFYWMKSGKNDFGEWAVHAAVLAALLGWRLWRRPRRAGGPR